MTAGRGRTFWWAASALLAVVIVLAGWFLGISPQLSAASDAEDDTASLQSQNQVLRASITTLQQQDADALRTDLRAAVAALPSDTALPALTRQITQQAQADQLTLDSITIGTPAAVGNGATDAADALQSIVVTVVSTGVGDNQRAFLKALQQQGPRRALVTSTNLSPRGGDDGTIAGKSSMTTTFTIFVAPTTAAAQAQLDKLLAGGTSS